ncbi:SAM-dependent methyltransferase [Nonomuraea sp. NPDC026600]|uniref:SAM-dependent methyltransferase n=1 Tax=Nonomuraea sp. NPDC026600 TaxID=3155363 RepID=UPI0033E6F6D3
MNSDLPGSTAQPVQATPPPDESAERAGAPAGIDPNTPNVARMYDYFLGGKDNFDADRQLAEELKKELPEVPEAVRVNRKFLGRAVQALAEEGISQFIDFGSGLPTTNNVHEIAQAIRKDACTVYVDWDKQVAVHGRALLATDDRSVMIHEDVRNLASILAMPEVIGLIDFDQPVAVLAVALLHFLSDDQEVAAILDVLRRELPEGSRVVLSHASPRDVPEAKAKAGMKLYERANASMTLRDDDRIQSLLPGWTWADPPGRIVPVAEWRASDAEAKLDMTRGKFVGGIAIPPPREPTQTVTASA